jgi:protein-disulfide isomerase
MRIFRTLLSFLVCALLMDAAAAQDVALITSDGVKQILANPGTGPVGAFKPDVVVVEYFDYNCPYCKKLVPTLKALLAQDSSIGLVYKDWAILGPVSEYAAASALAAGWQGKYLAAHEALLSGPRLAQVDQVDDILQRAGVNMEALKKDRVGHAREIAALLERNDAEAQALGLKGTPGIVVGRQLVAGIADLATLKTLVKNSRRDHE